MNRNRFYKKLTGLTLAMIMIIVTVMPALAQEQIQVRPSPWAVMELVESERLGLYTLDWYNESFLLPVTEEKLDTLLTRMDQRLKELDLKFNPYFQPVVVENRLTKLGVATEIYNILNQYILPEETKIDVLSPEQYMLKRNYIHGDGSGDPTLGMANPVTTEEAAVLMTRTLLDTFKLLDKGGKGFMWKVENKGNTVYLLGSIHMGIKEMYPIHEKVMEAFKQADCLYVEANLLNQAAAMQEFTKKSMFQDGKTLKDVVNAETYEKAVKAFKMYGLPEEYMGQFKPWQVANSLNAIKISQDQAQKESMGNTQLQGQYVNMGIDIYFLVQAYMAGKPIGELESLGMQADLFNGLSDEVQEDYLNGILDVVLAEKNVDEDTEATDETDLLLTWQKQWVEGDIDGFKTSYENVVDDSSEMNTMLFGKRDQGMADKIAKMLESDTPATYFIVVGAGHLAQDDVTTDKLREKGYKVEVFQ